MCSLYRTVVTLVSDDLLAEFSQSEIVSCAVSSAVLICSVDHWTQSDTGTTTVSGSDDGTRHQHADGTRRWYTTGRVDGTTMSGLIVHLRAF